jgi:hypothetical protein
MTASKKMQGKKRIVRGEKDFEKKKVKPGKLNPGAVNKTDTSFTAKKLLLKDQHLESTAASVHARLQPHCLTFVRHYSARNRKEALQGILRIVNPSNVKELLDLLTPVLVKCIVETEAKKEAGQLYALLFKTGDCGWLKAIWPHPLLAHFILAATNVDPHVHAQCLQLLSLFPDPLLLLVADQLLVPIARLMKQNDLEKASPPCITLLCRLLSLLTDTVCDSAVTEITWTPTLILPSPLFTRGQTEGRPEVSPAVCTQLIQITTNTMLLPWTEVAYLFLGQKSPARSDIKETAIYGNFQKILSKLFLLHSSSLHPHDDDNPWGQFCKHVPVKMFNSLHKCHDTFVTPK